jgi:hypothetical protein
MASKEKKQIASQVNNIIKNFYDDNAKHYWWGAYRYYGYFFSRYLEDKYNNVCSWKQDFPIFYGGGGAMITPKYIGIEVLKGNTYKMNVLKSFVRKCNKRFMVFPVTILFHQNIVIVDSKTKEVELFDSYGNEFEKEVAKQGGIIEGGYELYIDSLKAFFKEILGYKKYTFYRPVDFFPENKEFQNFEIKYCPAEKYKVNSWGFCVVWSFFYAETRISNPNIPRDKCVSNLLNIFDKEVNKLSRKVTSRMMSSRRKSSSTSRSTKKETIQLYNNDICKLIRSYTLFLVKLDNQTGFFKKMLVSLSSRREEFFRNGLVLSTTAFVILAPSILLSTITMKLLQKYF